MLDPSRLAYIGERAIGRWLGFASKSKVARCSRARGTRERVRGSGRGSPLRHPIMQSLATRAIENKMSCLIRASGESEPALGPGAARRGGPISVG